MGSVLVVHLHTLAFHPQETLKVKVGNQDQNLDDMVCTWGVRRIAELQEGARVVIFVGVTTIATGLSFFFGFTLLKTRLLQFCSLYVAIVMICWAN